jgi:hypothetical protein
LTSCQLEGSAKEGRLEWRCSAVGGTRLTEGCSVEQKKVGDDL